jgi:hypothetical protein
MFDRFDFQREMRARGPCEPGSGDGSQHNETSATDVVKLHCYLVSSQLFS